MSIRADRHDEAPAVRLVGIQAGGSASSRADGKSKRLWILPDLRIRKVLEKRRGVERVSHKDPQAIIIGPGPSHGLAGR
jgi:hypothetical protein